MPVACAFALSFIVQGLLSIPIQGSIDLFLAGTALHLFATTSLGNFLDIVARSLPQFGLLLILVLLPMQMVSGGQTPRESMPEWVQHIILVAQLPTMSFSRCWHRGGVGELRCAGCNRGAPCSPFR